MCDFCFAHKISRLLRFILAAQLCAAGAFDLIRDSLGHKPEVMKYAWYYSQKGSNG